MLRTTNGIFINYFLDSNSFISVLGADTMQKDAPCFVETRSFWKCFAQFVHAPLPPRFPLKTIRSLPSKMSQFW